MPCDIGYKAFQEVVLPVPLSKRLSKRVEAPKVDKDLLNKIGEKDSDFLESFYELDVDNLLGFVLSQVLESINTGGINFSIKDGYVSADAEYTSDSEENIKKLIDKVMNEFQMNVLKMIAELLNFETTIRETDKGFIIEAEKCNKDNSQVTRYLRISRDKYGKGEVMFEHYSSLDDLTEERAKFTVLAQKFGLNINLTWSKASGSPISTGIEHKGHLKQG